jgi:hypothetical protein
MLCERLTNLSRVLAVEIGLRCSRVIGVGEAHRVLRRGGCRDDQRGPKKLVKFHAPFSTTLLLTPAQRPTVALVLLTSLPVQSMRPRPSLLPAIMLSLLGLLVWITNSPTAYEWPAIDMSPFFMRHAAPHVLQNDFFANASSQPSPRHVFGWVVVWIAALLNGDWYAALFVIKALIVVSLPIAWYLAADALAEPWGLSDEQRGVYRTCVFIVVGLAVITGLPRLPDSLSVKAVLSVAWWPPYSTPVTAHVFSTLVGVTGIAFTRGKSAQAMYASVLLMALATLLHPTVGLGVVLLYVITRLAAEWRPDHATLRAAGIYLAVGWFLPAVVLKLVYQPAHPLPSREFVQVFAYLIAPWHYLPSAFATFSSVPWWVSWLLVQAAIVAAGAVAFARDDKRLSRASLLLWAPYFAFVAVAYVGVERVPVKPIAMLGLPRLTFIGYWMTGLVWSLLIARHAPASAFSRVATRLTSESLLATRRSLTALVAGILVSAGLCLLMEDDPFTAAKRRFPDLHAWLTRSTPADAVFAVPFGDLTTFMPWIALRAVVTGSGNPFNEDYLREYAERESLVFGSFDKRMQMPGRWGPGQWGERIANYYRSLRPSDFVSISRRFRIDYAIIEEGKDKSFSRYAPLFAGNGFRVYAIAQFQQPGGPAPHE